MIKVVAGRPDGSGVPMVYLGLDRNNTRMLHEGKPVLIHGADIGVPVNIVLLAGETLSDVAQDLLALGIRVPADRLPPAEKK